MTTPIQLKDEFKPGVVVKFTYSHPVVDKHTGDSLKEVFVLNPGVGHAAGVEGGTKMHGIDLRRITAAERQVLFDIFDPKWRESVKRGKNHPLPLVNDILRRMDPLEECKNPLSFYNKFVKQFLKRKDAYRQYDLSRASGLVVLKPSEVAGKAYNPKPLFKSEEGSPGPSPLFKKV